MKTSLTAGAAVRMSDPMHPRAGHEGGPLILRETNVQPQRGVKASGGMHVVPAGGPGVGHEQ
eukprot:15470559-Alexandrium_andersonii.AAC.1